MKLFEKVKNMFTEEVEEEVKVEQVPVKVKKDVSLPETIDSFDEVRVEKEEVKKPVFFTDHDFEDMENIQSSRVEKSSNDYSYNGYTNNINNRNGYNNSYNESRSDLYKDTYKNKQQSVYNEPYKEKKEERVFKPTPIISPVYGILDKNYHKDDIVSKTDVTYTPVDGLSVDTVRKKAYGTLEDELENTLFGSNSILFNKKDEENDNTEDFFGELEEEARPDLLDDLSMNESMGADEPMDENEKKIRDLEEITMDIGKELNSLLNKKESIKSREEYKKDEDDLFDLIDTMYEEDDEDAS